MKACHYQDRPGKRSLCLRRMTTSTLLTDMGWSNCSSPDECPHRSWDPEKRDGVTVVRSAVLGVCGACGGRHDTVSEQLRCTLDLQLRSAIERISGPGGSTTPLLDGKFPKAMMDRAWMKVRAAVIERDGKVCRDCGRDLTAYPSWYTEVHHIVPVIEGGSDRPENLVTLCVECHGRYTDNMWCGAPSLRPEGGGNSHRRKRRTSQSKIQERGHGES